jgi:DNA-binding MarR family transcriptional regulator
MPALSPAFDPIVANAARLRILAVLAKGEAPDFMTLRNATRLTDGNLVTHARRLTSAGLVAVARCPRDDGRLITTYQLTAAGREALERHAQDLLNALSPVATSSPDVASVPVDADQDDDWID